MKLTVGMAHHQDWEGFHSTVQSLALHHKLKDVELIVIDNSPNTHAGSMVAALTATWSHSGRGPSKYVPLTEVTGTSVPRDRIFKEASGDIVLVMDCHVLLALGSIQRLVEWFHQNPDSKDIVSGPLVYDSLRDWSTHFDDRWRSEMWGTWGQAWGCKCKQANFAVSHNFDNRVGYVTLHDLPQKEITACPNCGSKFPSLEWVQHEQALEKLGYKRLGVNDNDPVFEIPGQGLGLFACRREAWVGFHPHARGFGGEELWVHDKFRQAGGKALCLPALKWNHRFGKTSGVQYALGRYSKVRNYVLEFLQTHLDIMPIYNHFVSLDTFGQNLLFHLVAEHGMNPDDLMGKSEEYLQQVHREHKLTNETWNHLLADPIKHIEYVDKASPVAKVVNSNHALPPSNSSIDQIFTWALKNKRDLDEHLEKVKELASDCHHVTAVVKRREWDIGVLAARPKEYVSYNAEDDYLTTMLHEAVKLDAETERAIRSSGGKSSKVIGRFASHRKTIDELLELEIDPTEFLILDTVHSHTRVLQELNKYGPQVSKWILIRGTAAFGLKAENADEPGLEQGIGEFIANNPKWKRTWYTAIQYGLTLLSCRPQDRSIDHGPGTELHKIMESLDIHSSAVCGCRGRARQMDVWGAEECRKNINTILTWMREGAPNWGWTDKLKAAALAFKTGLAFKVDWSDPFPGIIEESIRRAEENERKAMEEAQ